MLNLDLLECRLRKVVFCKHVVDVLEVLWPLGVWFPVLGAFPNRYAKLRGRIIDGYLR